MMLYVQCEMSRGVARQTAWLPQKLAVRGKVLRVSGEDGWVVENCGVKMEERELSERSQDYKHQRKASDI